MPSNHQYPLNLGHFVDGDWIEPDSDDRIEVRDPCNIDRVVGSVPIASTQALTDVVDAAAAAFETWSHLPAATRSEHMKRAAAGIEDAADRIGRVVADELARPLRDAVNEVHAAARQFKYYAEEAVRIRGAIAQSDIADEEVLLLNRPVGVVLVVSPWNNPLFLLSRFVAPALATGCTVIAKPPSEGPLSTLLLTEAMHAAGLPGGVFNVVTGRGEAIARPLLARPEVRKACLTGGVTAGRALMTAAAEQLKTTALELGGQCPAIVCEDAQLPTTAEAIAFQAFRQGGQVCNRVNRVYAHENIYNELVGMLKERIATIRVGAVDDPDTDYAALINEHQLATAQQHVDDALAKGAKLETGGTRLQGDEFDRGWFFAPTLLSGCQPNTLVMTEETFGPVLGITSYRDFDEALCQANDTPYGLSAFVFTQNAMRCHRAMHTLEAGSIWINDIHLSYPQCPYGGCKTSGTGRTQGIEVMQEFHEQTTVYWDFSNYERSTRKSGH